jgi:5-methylcytosine-specific restriction endonuclease McrA
MIRYAVGGGRLDTEVSADAPTWRNRAQNRTNKIVKAGKYNEKKGIWSEVKPAFMRVQHSKCAYCERKFESPEYSSIENDLEHFRPKNDVIVWPDATKDPGLTYTFSTGVAHPLGYYWLAYDLQNYAAACKVCNTILKLNYFPIAGARGVATQTVVNLKSERPLLCYPIGNLDDNPEDIITFEATTAVPVEPSGYMHERAVVTIDFFKLNVRDQLHRERAEIITLFAPSLRAVSDASNVTPTDLAVVRRIKDPRNPHANCLRAFERLWQSDRVLAERVADACKAF